MRLPAALLPMMLLAACDQTAPAAPVAAAGSEAPASSQGATVVQESQALASGQRVVETPFGTAVIEEISLADAVHAEAGRLHVTYFNAAGEELGDYPEAVVMGSWGQMGEWRVRNDWGDYPVIQAEGGGTWQGFTCGWTSLTELRPEGPVELLTYQDYYDNSGSGWDPREEQTGTLEEPRDPTELTVTFTGTRSFTSEYRRTGNAYELVNGEELSGC